MKKNTLVYPVCIVFLMILHIACNKNNPPEIPLCIYPENNALDIQMNDTLKWECTDPDGDAISFDLYLGHDENPAIYETKLFRAFFPLENLSSNSRYYWKIIARDEEGAISESEIWSFSTGILKFTDTRDGNEYQFLSIGNQKWMAENLKYLPAINDNKQGAYDLPFYYVYDFLGNSIDDAKRHQNYLSYGVLYNWTSALTACPEGWRLPTAEDWSILSDYLISNGFGTGNAGADIAKALASKSLWETSDVSGSIGYNPSENNSSGFSALPAGRRLDGGGFLLMGKNTQFWSSDHYGESKALAFHLMHSSETPRQFNNYKNYGFSVRCIKNDISGKN